MTMPTTADSKTVTDKQVETVRIMVSLLSQDFEARFGVPLAVRFIDNDEHFVIVRADSKCKTKQQDLWLEGARSLFRRVFEAAVQTHGDAATAKESKATNAR